MNENIDYKATWNQIKSVFPILDDSYELDDKPFIKSEFQDVITFINRNKIAHHIQNLIISKIDKKLREEVIPEFWSYFKNIENNKGFQHFYNAVKCLYDNYKQLDLNMQKLDMFKQATKLNDFVYNEACVHSALKLMLRATLLSQLNLNYQPIVSNFYEVVLKMEDVEETNDGKCTICCQESVQCNCVHLFQETNRY